MSGRIEVNPSLPAVKMPARLLNEMMGHAREAHPAECCGLVVGSGPGRFEEVHRCRNEQARLHREDPQHYPRDEHRGFHMNEGDYHRVQCEAEDRGWQVTGIYHSHTEGGAYFSELDQEYANQPAFPFPRDAFHFVLSVSPDGAVTGAAAFRTLRAAGGAGFEGRRLEPQTP